MVRVILIFCWGFVSFSMRVLERLFEALSAWMARVRLQTKGLFLITKSVRWVSCSSVEPEATIVSLVLSASIRMVSLAFGWFRACLNSGFRSGAALLAATATMQLPEGRRWWSLVIISVVGWVAWRFLCP